MAHRETITVRREETSTLKKWMESLRSITLGPFNPKDPAIARLFGAGPTSTGISINEHTALNYSAVWAATSIIAGDVASFPLIFYKNLKGGGKERYTDHPLYYILHDQPNSEMTSMVWRETLQAHLLLWGNGYSEIERDQAGRPVALWPLSPDRVTPERDERTRALRYRVSSTNNQDVFLPAADMLHIPGLGFNGLEGYSVIRMARESLGLLAASERFGGSFFGQGATFGGILQHPKSITGKAKENLRDSFNTYHQGVEKAHRFLLLEEGMSYTRLGIQPNDAQFLETREFQIREVARWFNIPPHKLADLENAHFTNIEEENADYLASTLRRWLVRWEQEIKRKLISPRERNLQSAEHLIEGFLRGKTTERYAAYAVGRQWGWLSADDVREMENKNPLADGAGKIYLVPTNMAPADRINDVIDAQVEPKVVAAPPPQGGNEPDDRAAQLVILSGQLSAQADTIRELQERIELAHGELTTAQAEKLAIAAELSETRSTLATVTEESEQHAAGKGELSAAVEALVVERDSEMAALIAERKSHEATKTELSDATARAEHLDAECGKWSVVAAEAQDICSEAIAKRKEAEESARIVSVDLAREHEARQAAETAQADAEAGAFAAGALVKVHEQTAADAIVRAEMAETAQAETAAALRSQKETMAARLTELITANRAVLVDALGRMVRRETEKARSKRATAEKLRSWVTSFYEEHEAELWRDALQPAIAMHLALVDSPESPEEVTRQLVQAHMDVSVRQLRAVADADSSEYQDALTRTLNRWETERAAVAADAFVREEIRYVRAYQ